MFIVNRFVCFPSFLVQKGAGSSSFSSSLQRNHINGLQLQAEFSTNTCVSLFEFCVVNIIKFTIHHRWKIKSNKSIQTDLKYKSSFSQKIEFISKVYKIDIYQQQNLSCSFLLHSSLMVHAKEILDPPVLELYYVLKMGARSIFCTSN
jgi:hypothetical protein